MATYRKTREKYPLMDALAAAVAVDKFQGFIKAREGYYDEEKKFSFNDNRDVILKTLRNMKDRQEKNMPAAEGFMSFGDAGYAIFFSEEDREEAQKLFDEFDQLIIMKKMSDDLISKDMHGNMTSDFYLKLSEVFAEDEVDVNQDVAIIASLPHVLRVNKKREELEKFFNENRRNGYIGEIGRRLIVTGVVKDVKYLKQYGTYLVTMFADEGVIVKFFSNNDDVVKAVKEADENKTKLSVIGTVKKQNVNNFNNCEETTINRVKLAKK